MTGAFFMGSWRQPMSCKPCLCVLRSQPSFRSSPAPRSARAACFCSLVESDQAEGRDALRCRGGICDIRLRDGPWPPHRQTPGQASTGAKRTGESGGRVRRFPTAVSGNGIDPSVITLFGCLILLDVYLLFSSFWSFVRSSQMREPSCPTWRGFAFLLPCPRRVTSR